jgi:hypothetical protein
MDLNTIAESMVSGVMMTYEEFRQYFDSDNREVTEYLVLHEKDTGLPVKISVDDRLSNKTQNHSLWAYFKNNYKFAPRDVLPITISDNPIIPIKDYKLKISKADLNKVIKFITLNLELIRDLGNDRIYNYKFNRRFIPISGSNEPPIIENTVLKVFSKCEYTKYLKKDDLELLEFLCLRRYDTKLSVDIFVDDGHSYIAHDHQLWLYFKNNYDNNSHDILPLTISGNPKIPVKDYKLNISEPDLNKIVKFITLNLDLIYDLGNDRIRNYNFYKRFVPYSK